MKTKRIGKGDVLFFAQAAGGDLHAFRTRFARDEAPGMTPTTRLEIAKSVPVESHRRQFGWWVKVDGVRLWLERKSRAPDQRKYIQRQREAGRRAVAYLPSSEARAVLDAYRRAHAGEPLSRLLDALVTAGHERVQAKYRLPPVEPPAIVVGGADAGADASETF